MEPAARTSSVVLKGREMGKIMIAAMAVLTIGAAVPAAPIEAGAEEPARIVDAFHAALARGETTAALEMLADDAVIYESGGVERGKAEYASHHLEADAAFSKAVPSRVTRRTGAADGSVAWLLTEGRTTGTFKDRPVDRVTTETAMLRRVGGGWRITHFHWSSAAAKAAK
jgi:ketosteroid isomerase-like protein